jgi:hypothetical protein
MLSARLLNEHVGQGPVSKAIEKVLRAIEAGNPERVAVLLTTHSHHLIKGLKKQIAARATDGGPGRRNPPRTRRET